MITHSAPPHPVPPRTSLRITNRRRSLPASAATPPAQRSANHVNVKPASPAVISSLISTLSAISPPIGSPWGDLSDNYLSYSTPSSPLPNQAEYPHIVGPGGYVYKSDTTSPARMSFGIDCEVHHKSDLLKEKFYLDPNDAAGSPTIHKSPRRYPSDITMRSMLNGTEIEHSNALDETSSIGNLSIEPGPMVSSASIASIGSESRKSYRSFKSLRFRNSKSDLRKEPLNPRLDEVSSPTQAEVDTEHKTNGVDDFLLTAFESPMMIGSNAEKDLPPESQRFPSRASSVCITTFKDDLDSRSDGSKCAPGSVSSSRVIPTRDSSLRRSCGGSSPHQKRRSYRSDRSGPQEPEKLSFDYNRGSPIPISQSVFEDIAEDDVSRRIRELKTQKKLRDSPPPIITPESPIALETPGPSRTPSPLPLVKSVISQASYVLQASRAPEVEGYSVDEATESSAPSPLIMQRATRDKSTRVTSMPSKATINRPFPLIKHNTEPKLRTASLPQRSNSRLLRRLSRPVSPTNFEKHKRTFSNPLFDERPKSTDSVDHAVDDYISSSRLSQKITHSQTGRIISFSEVGDPDGSVIFCCVGMGLTRYITAFYDELASTLKLRLITPDRPGVGGSEAHLDGSDTPLGWPDDVLAICQHLKLTKFSILAHSAGAIYALATALRMPQHIRGRIHLLAPWIPPSQMSAFGAQQDASPVGALPYSQRFLRSLPTPFLRAANSSFLNATSARITTSLPKSPRRSKRKSISIDQSSVTNGSKRDQPASPNLIENGNTEASISKEAALSGTRTNTAINDGLTFRIAEKVRQSTYDIRLTEAIWNSATTDANPAVDLLICLERCQPIGFRYVDITRSVVIHHGSKDNRVPVENVKWLAKSMRRCEVRVLEGEGHGLMASAAVMGGVLMEMAKEWEDWIRLVRGKSGTERKATR